MLGPRDAELIEEDIGGAEEVVSLAFERKRVAGLGTPLWARVSLDMLRERLAPIRED